MTREAHQTTAVETEARTRRTSMEQYWPLLDVIRIVAVIGVVTVHVTAEHVSPDGPVSLLVLRSLLATAVPAFVMISGALNLAPRAVRHGSVVFLRRRLRRLLPATVAWTAFYVIGMQVLLAQEPFRWREVVADLLSASSYTHLYFLPLIIGLTLVTPMLAAYVDDSSRRLWWSGIVAALWALCVMAIPPLSSGVLGEDVATLQLGALTYFLPFIGYYVLGRAAWTAPPSRRVCTLLLVVGVPSLTAVTVWAYASPVTQQPPGQFLLPTYLSPTVMALSLAVVIGVMGWGRQWQVGARTARLLRSLGNATFGVFLVHFALLVPLRELGFPEDSFLDVFLLLVIVTIGSFLFAVLCARIPGVRALV